MAIKLIFCLYFLLLKMLGFFLFFFFFKVLEEVKVKREIDRDILIQVARTSLRTKVHQDLADLLTEVKFTLDSFKCNKIQSNS